MPRGVPKPPDAFAPPLTVFGSKRAPLLTVIARHELVDCDLQLAHDLSDLLRESISQGSSKTYQCGFESLSVFCRKRNLCPMPVNAVTLCSWMMHKCQTVKVKSVVKYTCGIRFAHILEGFDWSLTGNPLVQLTIKSLKKKYPTSNVLQKVPLSLSMLLRMCASMSGWPSLSKLSFDDLTWATASAIGFYACLRGGEFFVQPKSERPILTGGAVSIRAAPTGPYVFIEVPSPKTRKDLVSIPAIAMSTVKGFCFDPVILLTLYRERAAAKSIHVLGKNAAFKSSDGKPISRVFMVSRAEKLRSAAGIEILNSSGNPIKVSAASWRADLCYQHVRQVSCRM